MSTSYKINNPEGIYFITFAVVEWVDVFTRKRYVDIVLDSLKYCQEEKGLILFGWCIMSSHVHLIAKAEGGNLSDILRDLKKFTSVQILKSINEEGESRRNWMLWIFKKAGEKNGNNKNFQVWQQSNHAVELESNQFMQQKLDYIHNNAVVAGFVEKPEDYLYSSAKDYCGEKGLLPLELMV